MKMKEKRSRLVLTPECYRSWALSPHLLLTHDLVMDQRDFDNAQSKKDMSTYHRLVAKALHIYREEGMLHLENYANFLSPANRQLIHNYAKDLILKQKEQDLLAYGRFAYKEYTSYQTEILDFFGASDSLYVDQVRSRNETLSHLSQLKAADRVPRDFNFIDVMTRIIAKAFAGLHIAMKFDLPFHDTEEYRPGVSWILSDCLLNKRVNIPSLVDSPSQEFGPNLLAEIFNKILHPDIKIRDSRQFPVIMQKRNDFVTLAKLLFEIEDLYKEARKVVGDEELISKIVFDVAQIDKQIDYEISRIQSRKSYKIPWTLFKILTTIKAPYIGLLEEKLKKESTGRIRGKVEKKYPEYTWFFIFKQISRRSLNIWEVSKVEGKKTPARIETWLRGNLPWYERPNT